MSFLTNANISCAGRPDEHSEAALLDPRPRARSATTPELLAAGLGMTTYILVAWLEDPEIAALAHAFAMTTVRACLGTSCSLCG